jgi:isoleucyl-tRNA synthetase
MSKSLGNVVLPTEICDKWGADLLRLWVASQDYTADVRMSDNVMTQLSEAYRKIRNTFRFVAGNLHGFDPEGDALPDSQMWEVDRWMLSRTAELVRQCRQRYDAFEFHRVFHALHDFCVVDLSAFYFDVLKDRLYTLPGRPTAVGADAIHRIASAPVRLPRRLWFHRGGDLSMCRGLRANSIHLARSSPEEIARQSIGDSNGNTETSPHRPGLRNGAHSKRLARGQGPSWRTPRPLMAATQPPAGLHRVQVEIVTPASGKSADRARERARDGAA